jgi:hypothetical protein
MAGLYNVETVQIIDGESFISTLKGEMRVFDERPLFWHYPNEWGPSGPGIGAASAVRSGDWKLIYFYENQKIELFNLNEDIGETKNLENQYPEKVEELAHILTNYLKKVNAQIPLDKLTKKPIPYPVDVLKI